jgi:uncharacterized secreted protein with C-terminal beta-propeller domain
MRNLNHFRQGDVYFRKVEIANVSNYKEVKPENNQLVLAYGEVTGHHHSIMLEDDSNVKLYRNSNGDMILEVKDKEATLTHQEHSPITFLMGTYEAYIQEEYDPEGMRRVLD